MSSYKIVVEHIYINYNKEISISMPNITIEINDYDIDDDYGDSDGTFKSFEQGTVYHDDVEIACFWTRWTTGKESDVEILINIWVTPGKISPCHSIYLIQPFQDIEMAKVVDGEYSPWEADGVLIDEIMLKKDLLQYPKLQTLVYEIVEEIKKQDTNIQAHFIGEEEFDIELIIESRKRISELDREFTLDIDKLKFMKRHSIIEVVELLGFEISLDNRLDQQIKKVEEQLNVQLPPNLKIAWKSIPTFDSFELLGIDDIVEVNLSTENIETFFPPPSYLLVVDISAAIDDDYICLDTRYTDENGEYPVVYWNSYNAKVYDLSIEELNNTELYIIAPDYATWLCSRVLSCAYLDENLKLNQ